MAGEFRVKCLIIISVIEPWKSLILFLHIQLDH